MTLVATKSCLHCPSAKIFWKRLKAECAFDYEEVDAMSEKGQELVYKFSIISVPTSIIEVGKKDPVLFIGVPSKEKTMEALSE